MQAAGPVLTGSAPPPRPWPSVPTTTPTTQTRCSRWILACDWSPADTILSSDWSTNTLLSCDWSSGPDRRPGQQPAGESAGQQVLLSRAYHHHHHLVLFIFIYSLVLYAENIFFQLHNNVFTYFIIVKLREREGQRVHLGRSLKMSFIDGGWWMVDILSLMLYTLAYTLTLWHSDTLWNLKKCDQQPTTNPLTNNVDIVDSRDPIGSKNSLFFIRNWPKYVYWKLFIWITSLLYWMLAAVVSETFSVD